MQRIISVRLPLAAVALILCLGLAGGPTARAGPAEAGMGEFRILNGCVFGVLDRRPLAQVLESFAQATGMDYDLPAGLRGLLVSGRYQGLPAGAALSSLLRHIDHTAVWRADGTLARLRVTGLRASYRDLGVTVGPETSAEPETGPKEPWEGATAPRGMTEEELLEAAAFMDLEQLAEQAGLSVEDFYFEPSGDQLEPQLNFNLLNSLLARAAAPPVSREMLPMELTAAGLEAPPKEPWEKAAAPSGMTEEELLEAAAFMDLEQLAEQAGLSVEEFYFEPSGDQFEPQLNLNLLMSVLAKE